MGATLFGGEKSGTPVETRGGTADLAQLFQSFLQSGNPFGMGNEFGRLATESMVNMLGFDPSQLGLGDAAAELLLDPADRVSGLFSSMVPFEAAETDRQISGLRGSFGSMGGRFSRNLADAEVRGRGELAAQFGRNREQALLQAAGQRLQALMGVGGMMQGARSQAFNEQFAPFQLMSQFLQPGAPIIQQGALGGLLGTAGTLAGLRFLGGGKK